MTSGKSEAVLESRPDTVIWGRLPCESDVPVFSIASGEVIKVATVSHEGIMEDQGRDPLAWFASRGVDPALVPKDAVEIASKYQGRDPERDGPHIVTGPIFIKGAEPGGIVRIDFLELLPRAPFGVVSTRHFRGALAGEYPLFGDKTLGSFELESPDLISVLCHCDFDATKLEIRSRQGDGAIRFPMSPFLGLVGVTPAGKERRHSVPPGEFGGNMDVRDLVVGSTLYLRVQSEGAGLYIGDPHYAQGHGEVALTAVEAPLLATLRATVLGMDESARLVGHLSAPLGESDTHWFLLGLDRDLNEAMKSSVREALRFLTEVISVPKEEAYAYLSAAADFVVTQVVDDIKGVHCRIRKEDFATWV